MDKHQPCLPLSEVQPAMSDVVSFKKFVRDINYWLEDYPEEWFDEDLGDAQSVFIAAVVEAVGEYHQALNPDPKFVSIRIDNGG